MKTDARKETQKPQVAGLIPAHLPPSRFMPYTAADAGRGGGNNDSDWQSPYAGDVSATSVAPCLRGENAHEPLVGWVLHPFFVGLADAVCGWHAGGRGWWI